MRHHPITLVLLLLAAAAAGVAEQGGAPLEASKKALQELQADQAVKPGVKASGSKLTDGLPHLQTPSPGAAAPDPVQPGKRQNEEQDMMTRRQNQANWLLDGVDQLGRDAKGRQRPTRENRKKLPEQGDDKPDSSDPNYLLKLYAQQKKEAREKAEARQTPLVRTDPIAPFLQEWLGDSPVRGKFFDEYVRKADAGSRTASAAGLAHTGSNQLPGHTLATADRHTAAPVTPQSNPYLAGLESPANFESGTRSNEPLPASLSIIGGGPSGTSPGAALEPIPSPQAAAKKPSLLAPSDNEKYFPQQKKF